MTAPSQEHVWSLNDGRVRLEYVAVFNGSFSAKTVDSRKVGLFASQGEATAALQAAHGKQKAVLDAGGGCQ